MSLSCLITKNTTFVIRALAYFMLMILFSVSNANATLITTFINEIHYDNAGTDSNEFIEIASLATSNLQGWSVQLYNGHNGTVYKTLSLNTFTLTNPNNGFAFMSIELNGLQNGTQDGIALFDQNEQLVQFLSYEGTLTANDGLAQGYTSVDIGVAESSTTDMDFSLQLAGNGMYYHDFTWQNATLNTKGMVNNQQTFFSSSAILPPLNQVDEPKTISMFLLMLLVVSLINHYRTRF